MIIYGLQTCPQCQKAEKALNAAGKTTTFRDIRAEPLTEAEIAELYAEFGDRLVDQSTNDYRALNMWLKNSEADAQIASQPKVMARPIILDDDTLHLGWDETVQGALGLG